MEIYIDNMSHEYRANLENLDIIQFVQLLQKARKIVVSIKPSIAEKPKLEKKNVPQTLTVFSSEPMVGVKRKREEEELEEYHPIPCTNEEMNAVINKWMANRVLRPFKPNREPTLEDKKKPFYCWYH